MATPVPLSLIPGPSGTESACAPSITVPFADPVRVSAITLRVRRRSETASTRMRAGRPTAARSRAPVSGLVPSTGTRTPGPPRVPGIVPGSELTTRTAAAPARAASSAFARRVQVPRETTATSPGSTAAWSAAAQPTPATAARAPRTSPPGENRSVAIPASASPPSMDTSGFVRSSKNGKETGCSVTA